MNPESQAKVKEELNAVFGRDKCNLYSDTRFH